MAGYKPRVFTLSKKPKQTFGFYLRVENGEEGHLIRCLEMGGPAELAGIKDGDRILRVNGTFVDECPHSEVSRMQKYCSALIKSITTLRPVLLWQASFFPGQVVDLVKISGTSVTFHILDESSYKQAKAQGVNLSNPGSKPVANGVEKHRLKPKLCYLVKSSSSFGFSIRSVEGKERMQGLPILSKC